MSVHAKIIEVYKWICPECNEIHIVDDCISEVVSCDKCRYSFEIYYPRELKN